MILIIGAGLAGLSAAYHLDRRDYRIFEREGEVGGLCRSYRRDGFTFDYTGHLLHLKSEYTRNLLKDLLPCGFTSHQRKASIYSQGVYTPYPFQANLYRLPREVIKECLLGFIEAGEARERTAGGGALNEEEPPASFEEWIITTFGGGIARYFMLPYNQKLWRRDLGALTSEWVEWSVPVPSLDEVVGGALGVENRQMGYSANFLYPEEGGIGVLPQAFLPFLDPVTCNRSLVSVSVDEKRVWFDDGSSEGYRHLVSTVPLPELLGMIRELPSRMAELRERLEHISVLDINLGVRGSRFHGQHWVYFPEHSIPFYRAGSYSNFSASSAPGGSSSLYLELSYLPGRGVERDALMEGVSGCLTSSGLLDSEEQIVVSDMVDIPYAYVVYNRARREILPEIMSYLEGHGIHSIGRYGSWQYLSMEDSLLQGKSVAETING